MSKKGVELPQNVIVIAIIVLVVLVVMIAFFAGGTASIGQRIKSIFSAGVDDKSTSISFCEQYCQNAQSYNSKGARSSSSYCTRFFSVDTDGDGKSDKSNDQTIRFYCSNSPPDAGDIPVSGLGVPCPGVEEDCIQ